MKKVILVTTAKQVSFLYIVVSWYVVTFKGEKQHMQSIDMQLLYVKSSNCLYEVIVIFKYDIANCSNSACLTCNCNRKLIVKYPKSLNAVYEISSARLNVVVENGNIKETTYSWLNDHIVCVARNNMFDWFGDTCRISVRYG